MSSYALISGTIFTDPIRRTSKSGNPFVTVKLRVKDGAETSWWQIAAFDAGVQEELLKLSEGDSVAVQGAMKADVYVPDNAAPRVNLNLVADAVLPARRPKTPRPAPAARKSWQANAKPKITGRGYAGPGDPDDDISDLWGRP